MSTYNCKSDRYLEHESADLIMDNIKNICNSILDQVEDKLEYLKKIHSDVYYDFKYCFKNLLTYMDSA